MLDVRRIEKDLACDLEIDAALVENSIVFGRVPGEVIFEVMVYSGTILLNQRIRNSESL